MSAAPPLPPGFSLDAPVVPMLPAALPSGFKLDAPPQPQPSLLDTAAHLLGIPHTVGEPEAFARGAADTLTMGFGDEGGAALGINPFQGDWAGQYQAGLDKIRSEQAASQQAHPGAFFTGQVAGGVLPMAVPGFGEAKAASVGGTILKGIGTGAAYGGAYGFGSGDSLSDRALGAAGGAVTGGALGGVLAPVGRGVAAALPVLRGAPSRAAALFARSATADGFPTMGAITNGLWGMGPDAVAADLGPNLQHQAGALASLPGQPQSAIRDYLWNRAQGANARIQGDINTTLGPTPDIAAAKQAIADGQTALQPQYAAVLANAKAVDTGNLALTLDSQAVKMRGAAQKAARDVRGWLNIPGTDQLDRDPATLLETRKAIDGQMATETDPNARFVLANARAQVDTMLGNAVPGIKGVDAQYAELARQNDALDRGATVLDSGRTAPTPNELDAEVYAASQPQGTLVGPSGVGFRLTQGARAEIDRIVGTKANDVTALNNIVKGDGSWNRDKLVTLFGADKADQILSVLDRERAYAKTSNVVTGNSETAARQSAQAEVSPPKGSSGAGVVQSAMNMRFGDAAGRVGKWFAGSHADARLAATNQQLAQLLTTPMPANMAAPNPITIALQVAARQQAAADAARMTTNLMVTPTGRALIAAGLPGAKTKTNAWVQQGLGLLPSYGP